MPWEQSMERFRPSRSSRTFEEGEVGTLAILLDDAPASVRRRSPLFHHLPSSLSPLSEPTGMAAAADLQPVVDGGVVARRDLHRGADLEMDGAIVDHRVGEADVQTSAPLSLSLRKGGEDLVAGCPHVAADQHHIALQECGKEIPIRLHRILVEILVVDASDIICLKHSSLTPCLCC